MSAERSSAGSGGDLGAPATRPGLSASSTAPTLTVDLPHGWARALVHVRAEDRTDCQVEVRPSDPAQEADVVAAEKTRVVLTPEEAHVSAPNIRRLSFLGPAGSIDVDIAVPLGTDARIKASGGLRCQGRLGETVLDIVMGDVRVEHTGRLRLKSASGDVMVTQIDGRADVTATNGRISLRDVHGMATVWASNGDIVLGDVDGEVHARTASGHISVDRAQSTVSATTASGSIRIGEAVRGSLVLNTGAGEIEIGVRSGTAVLLDVRTRTGNVRTALEATDGPEKSADRLVVKARTAYGDIVINRATPPDAPSTPDPSTSAQISTDPTTPEETR